MNTTRHTAKTMIAGLVASLVLTAPLQAQMAPMPDKSSTGTMDSGNKMGAGGMMSNGGMMGMGGMMQMHEKMQADMKAMDDELDVLVVKMNQASGDNKADAMAAVITKMAEQRKIMDQKMAAMQSSMMQGMMGGMKMTPPVTPPMKMTPPMTMPQSK